MSRGQDEKEGQTLIEGCQIRPSATGKTPVLPEEHSSILQDPSMSRRRIQTLPHHPAHRLTLSRTRLSRHRRATNTLFREPVAARKS